MSSARFVLVTAIAAAFGAATGIACSSGLFTWDAISDSDSPVLRSPRAFFEDELMRLTPQGAPAPVLPDGYRAATSRPAEAADLAEALPQRGLAPDVVADVIRRVTALRGRFESHMEVLWRWQSSGRRSGERPKLEDAEPPAELPAEFALHLRGMACWADGRIEEARDAWQRVLALPQAERRYRSTWSAYMLGRSWVEKDRARTTEYLELCRDLAAKGFKDTDHLAAASYGREARAWFLAGDCAKAIELYLLQRDGGTLDAASLRTVARVAAQQPPAVLNVLAAKPGPRRVMTAYLLSLGDDEQFVDPSLLKSWLAALEAAGALDEDADRLAWIAYTAGEFDLADRFLSRLAAETPISAWISAKLRVREGRLDEAAALLSRAERGFTDPGAGLRRDDPRHRWDVEGTAEDRAVVELCRSRYGEALDLFLRTGHWTDATYLAERVLTPEELRDYVNRRPPSDPEEEKWGPPTNLRPVLARRLARLRRFGEARPYFDEDLRPALDSYAAALAAVADESKDRDARAKSFRDAATIARQNGEKLLSRACEHYPDEWYDDANRDVDARATERGVGHAVVSPDEHARLAKTAPPDGRLYHHDFDAADLAWSAAELMPDESQETAEWLREAASWVEAKDPKAAERFYDAIVARCGKTALGREARRLGALPPAAK